MLSGGWHADQEQFWVHVDIPQSYIDSRLEEEEASRVKKELAAKKKAAEAAVTDGTLKIQESQTGMPDFVGENI